MKEIERKFLVNPQLLPKLGRGMSHVQGYLSFDPEIRVRIYGDSGRRATITYKSTEDFSRDKEELKIRYEDARKLLERSRGVIISKRRFLWKDVKGACWEIDEYGGSLTGLWIAELELVSETQDVEVPAFVIGEVTGNSHFKNRKIAEEASSLDSLLGRL